MGDSKFTDKGWVVFPLEHEIKRIVFPRKSIEDLRKISRQSKEFDGMLFGVIKDQDLYFMGSTILGIGDRMRVGFNESYRQFHNKLVLKSKQVNPSLTTILYHNHPVLMPEEYTQEVLEGMMYCYKIRDIKQAIKKFSKILSEEDINSTFGRTHVLVTDTSKGGDDFAHINAYKIEKNISPDNFKTFNVVSLSDMVEEDCRWAGGVCSSLKRVYDQLREDYKLRK